MDYDLLQLIDHNFSSLLELSSSLQSDKNFVLYYEHTAVFSKDYLLFKSWLIKKWRNFSEYLKSIREKQNLRKAAKSKFDEVEKYVQLNSSDNCVHCYNVEILNTFDSELEPINTKPMIRIKLKEIFHSSPKLIASDSDIDEAFKSMHQSIMRKIKKYSCKNLIDLDMIIKHSIKTFEC